MKILIACEFSGIVREAFRRKGHDAWSCDLLPAEDKSRFHIRGNVLDLLSKKWDRMICHPPCKFTALCQIWRRKPSRRDCIEHGLSDDDVTWRLKQRKEGIEFAEKLWTADIPQICLEQPKTILGNFIGKKTQTIHPWQFGHGEKKETWLWLKNLPPLVPTKIVSGREENIFRMPPSETRSIDRSRTYKGIAAAMADQWL